MKRFASCLSLFIVLMSSNISLAQGNKEIEMGKDILQIIEASDAINKLVIRRGETEEKLTKFNAWVLENKISPATYQRVENSYETIGDHMNNLLGQLEADLRSIKSIKQFENIRLDESIDRYNDIYSSDLLIAKRVYVDEFLPAYQQASKEAGLIEDKSADPVTLLAIVKIGGAVIGIVQEIISKSKEKKALETELLSLGMDFAIGQIDKKLRYKDWDDFVTVQEKSEDRVASRLNSDIEEAPYYRKAQGTIKMVSTTNNQPYLLEINEYISLRGLGADTASRQIPLYQVTQPMKKGDKFKVEIDGYQFVSFFYFDEGAGCWKEVAVEAKSIGIQNDKFDLNGQTAIFPSTNSSFTIEEDHSQEILLVLLSNQVIPAGRKNVIQGLTEVDEDFIQKLDLMLWNVKPNTSLNKSLSVKKDKMGRVEIAQSHSTQMYVPVYIKIPRQ